MLADYGFYLLLLCFISSFYGCSAAIASLVTGQKRLFTSALLAQVATTLLCLGACAILFYLFFTRDYSVAYVFKNSSNDLPSFYTLSAFWSALEGSHFLWTTLLCLCVMIAHLNYSKENEALIPYVSATLQAVLAWMFYLAISYCDPFKSMFPVRDNGMGMNALLQNPYMAIHPPALFSGYSACAIPFAYSIAVLCHGSFTSGWLKCVRQWAMFGWMFLTAGIFLGGRWAYVELGWAGYWAWDPVENSSFMPWIFTTGLIHSLYVQDKMNGVLRRLSLVLSFFAFFFGFFGTFITRSGIISSVHSFAQSPIGPNYLYFLVTLALGTILLYAFRSASLLPEVKERVRGLSKESLLVLAQFLLACFAFIIFMGTLYPIISELVTGSRFNVQAPYFNSFAPYIGFSLILGLTFANLMRFRSPEISGGYKLLLAAFLLACPMTLLFSFWGDVAKTHGWTFGIQIAGIVLCFWSVLCLLIDLLTRCKNSDWRWGVFLNLNLSYIGATFAHIGFIVAILGFLGNYRGMDTLVTLNSGEKTEFYGYTFEFEGIQLEKEANVELFTAPLKISKQGQDLGYIKAARAMYPTKSELFHEIGLKDSFWYDLYVVLSDFDKSTGKQATFEIHINHTVKIVWISAYLMVFGALLTIVARLRNKKLRGVVA